MNKNVTLSLTLLAAAVAGAGGLRLAGTSPVFAQGSAITVHDAWVREPVGDRMQTAAFAVVDNSGPTSRAIVGASADVAEKVELHEMKMMGPMMQMSPVKQIEVPARGRVELRPGSLHLMLFGLKRMPVAGETVNLTLTFDDGTTVSAAAQVRRMAGMR